ncbi:MAG: endonuclease III [Methanomicrobiales archaeon HGW-Methanomicrobiales-4]|nr:MAG: endonuclease III [Methanomicrobiales archaeon HGW-Methanomicrobiales-4]
MPWRDNITPYRVVVSEVMLQQTQVTRVKEKFTPFIRRFPDFSTLSLASLADVMKEWQGLGYNRRAKSLHAIAIHVMEEWEGVLPQSPEDILILPGIGMATAASITVFAYNAPVVFIETNIRRVFIHHFFSGSDPVSDAQILPLVELTLDNQNPREWYYALMDYGTWLAKRMPNPNRRSRHYSRQSAFEGSDRQIRGRILKRLISETICSLDILISEAGDDQSRGTTILSGMIQEGLLCESDGYVKIADICGKN